MIGITIAGLPMGISMIVASIFYLFFSGQDVGLAAENVLNGVFGNFVALAVPLFIFAANIMNAGKVSDRILTFCLGVGWAGARRFGPGEYHDVAHLFGHERIGHLGCGGRWQSPD